MDQGLKSIIDKLNSQKSTQKKGKKPEEELEGQEIEGTDDEQEAEEMTEEQEEKPEVKPADAKPKAEKKEVQEERPEITDEEMNYAVLVAQLQNDGIYRAKLLSELAGIREQVEALNILLSSLIGGKDGR